MLSMEMPNVRKIASLEFYVEKKIPTIQIGQRHTVRIEGKRKGETAKVWRQIEICWKNQPGRKAAETRTEQKNCYDPTKWKRYFRIVNATL